MQKLYKSTTRDETAPSPGGFQQTRHKVSVNASTTMRLTAALTMLPVISVHTLAFSWRRHDSSKSFPDVEYTVFRDLAIPGLLLPSRKTSHLISVRRNWA